MVSRLKATAFGVLLAFVATTAIVRADGSEPVRIKLHPMAVPTPALKYHLLPTATETVTGNAAVPYGKVTAEEMTYFKKYAQSDVIDEWQEMPLDKLRSEKIPLPEMSIGFLEQGAKCKYCDWQLPIGQVAFYTILLPDAQETRSFARVLAVKARVEIANGNYAEAIKTFRTTFALGRNVATGETLINGLIGIAINGIITPQVIEFVQQPDAPNLYWSLTVLPRPMIEMAHAVEVESQAVELSFPNLRDVEDAERSPEEWQGVFQHFATTANEWTATGERPSPKLSAADLDKLCKDSETFVREKLIAAGFEKKRVERMPVEQAILVHLLRTYHEQFDAAARYYGLPYPQAEKGIQAATQQVRDSEDPVARAIPVSEHALSALIATRRAVARDERNFAALRVVEALRIYGAAHDAKLPQQLSDITEVPIPDDPATGQPFNFRRDGDKVVIESPALNGLALNYEITMSPAPSAAGR
jgi:hypothetical protein